MFSASCSGNEERVSVAFVPLLVASSVEIFSQAILALFDDGFLLLVRKMILRHPRRNFFFPLIGSFVFQSLLPR